MATAIALFQMLPQKRHDLVTVVINPGFFAEGVVAAGDRGFAVLYFKAAKRVERVA